MGGSAQSAADGGGGGGGGQYACRGGSGPAVSSLDWPASLCCVLLYRTLAVHLFIQVYHEPVWDTLQNAA